MRWCCQNTKDTIIEYRSKKGFKLIDISTFDIDPSWTKLFYGQNFLTSGQDLKFIKIQTFFVSVHNFTFYIKPSRPKLIKSNLSMEFLN